MTIEIAIAVSAIIGLVVGLYANRKGIKERDARISELEKEISTNRNVMEAQNDTIGRLRRKLEKNNDSKTNRGSLS